VYLRTVEINVSCPNTDHSTSPSPTAGQMYAFSLRRDLTVIWKLPPVEAVALPSIQFLAGYGARYFHLSNALPSPVGGVSGAPLREANLRLVEKATRDDVEIIAGGGIYSPDHVRQYRDAGATRFSLATAWFWPPRARRILKECS
jgi:dihydroorotate dehydrogenase